MASGGYSLLQRAGAAGALLVLVIIILWVWHRHSGAKRARAAGGATGAALLPSALPLPPAKAVARGALPAPSQAPAREAPPPPPQVPVDEAAPFGPDFWTNLVCSGESSGGCPERTNDLAVAMLSRVSRRPSPGYQARLLGGDETAPRTAAELDVDTDQPPDGFILAGPLPCDSECHRDDLVGLSSNLGSIHPDTRFEPGSPFPVIDGHYNAAPGTYAGGVTLGGFAPTALMGPPGFFTNYVRADNPAPPRARLTTPRVVSHVPALSSAPRAAGRHPA